MPHKTKKYSTFTAWELQELLRKLRSKDELSLMSRQYMLNKRNELQQRYEERLMAMERRRQAGENERVKRLIELKLISPKDISDDKPPQKEVGDDVSFQHTKRHTRRCTSPPPKETILDPVERYHKSVFVDPFGVLGIETPKPVNVDTSDLDAVTATYNKTYDEPKLQSMAEAANVSELYERAEEAVLRSPEGCKSQFAAP